MYEPAESPLVVPYSRAFASEIRVFFDIANAPQAEKIYLKFACFFEMPIYWLDTAMIAEAAKCQSSC